MYHPLAMHIQQSPGDSFELPGTIAISDERGQLWEENPQARTDLHPYVPR